MELERKAQRAESRAVMAEEQLDALQKYMAQASVTYQREIMRLRAVIGQLDPTGEALRMNPIHPQAAAAMAAMAAQHQGSFAVRG